MILLLYVLLGKIVAISIGLIYWKNLPKPFRIVLVLAVIGLFFEIAGYYVNKVLHMRNVWLFNLYMPIEPIMLGIAGTYFSHSAVFKRIVYLLLLANFTEWIVSIFMNSLNTFASFSMICGCFLLVIVYTFLLVNMAIDNNEGTLVQHPLLWLSLSIILYFGCDIPYMGMFHLMKAVTSPLLRRMYNINQILNFIRYPLVAVSFLLAAKQNKQSQTSTMAYVSK